MIAAKVKEENPRMKAADFERIMSQALQVSPSKDKKAKGVKKSKKTKDTKKKKTKR
jgi:hypothetical protein